MIVDEQLENLENGELLEFKSTDYYVQKHEDSGISSLNFR